MGSPESSKPPPTTPAPKDSPFIHFASNLSPIEAFSNRSSGQVFDNIDVPSPQLVFTTPQHRLINSNPWKRSQTIAFPRRNALGDVDDSTESLRCPGANQHPFPASVVRSDICGCEKFICNSEKRDNSDHLHDQLYSSPSCVDVYLSIPLEDCDNTSYSVALSLKEVNGITNNDDIIPVNSSGVHMASPNDDSAQGLLIKSSAIVNNPIAESAMHLEVINMQNKDDPPKAMENDGIVDERSNLDHINPNTVECGGPKVVTDQNASLLPENCAYQQQNPYGPNGSTTFEESGTRGEHFGQESGVVSKTCINSASPLACSSQGGHILLDMKEADHSCVASSINHQTDGHADECPSTSSSNARETQDLSLCSSRTEYWSQLDLTTEAKSESLVNVLLHDHLDASGLVTEFSTKGQTPQAEILKDSALHYRGMCKRLQFEDCERHEVSMGYHHDLINMRCPHSMSESVFLASNAECLYDSYTNSTPDKLETIQSTSGNVPCSDVVEADIPERIEGRFTAIIPRPSGIGLHLNAIGSPGQMSCQLNMKFPTKGLGIHEKSFFNSTCHINSQGLKAMMVNDAPGQSSVHSTSNSDDSSLGSMGECNNESHEKPAQGCHSQIEAKQLNMKVQPRFYKHHITPCCRKVSSEEATKSENSTQTSLGKKRKEAPEVEGQKRCNCKKSKCLKLYCDCFAAGAFCNKACSCEGCSNKPEHEGVVCSIKQQIVTRNPLAFAPKVVHANYDTQVGDNHITPPSARHKTGCNCKKSKCLKKYCECYQAGVGCSLGCRCEACENPCGTKEAYCDVSRIVIEHKKLEEDANKASIKIVVVESDSEECSAKQCNAHLNLPKPSAKAKNLGRNHFSSGVHQLPDSDGAAFPSCHSPTSTKKLKSHCAPAEEIEKPSSVDQCKKHFDRSSASMVDSLSPGWSGFPDICKLSPLSDLSPKLCGSSSSMNTRAKVAHARLFQGRGDSLRRHCSPVTPLRRFGEGKFLIEPSTSRTQCNLEHETPEFLEDAHSPVKPIKAGSPNQKRVSPPKTKLNETGPSFSTGLKSGRKFILHSIPQFPPLTPYRNNSKEATGDRSEGKSGA